MTFKVNNDLDKIVFSWHNKFHFYISLIMAAILTVAAWWILDPHMPTWLAIGLATYTGHSLTWTAWHWWDVGDGFKPWWTEGSGKPWIIQQLFFADGYSIQDVLIWDLIGSIVGSIIGALGTIIYLAFSCN